jgi:hypothetical protein
LPSATTRREQENDHPVELGRIKMKLPLIIAAAAILATGAAQAQLQQAATCCEAAAFQKQQCGTIGGRIAVCQNNIEQARQNCMQTGKWGGRNLRRE